MTRTEYFFEADAAIIARLGRELVAKQDTALIELIKNSFDADATTVTVKFASQNQRPAIEIQDNGSGMTQQDLINGFLRLASANKVSEPLSPKYHRRRAGRKGIGRFAAHRLGDFLVLTTRHESEETGWRLTVDWRKFVLGTELSQIPVIIEKVDVAAPGTNIRIEALFDQWSDTTMKRVWRNVLGLQQPFPVAPVESNPISDPGFSVRFLRENSLFQDETVVADLQTEILDYMHAVIEYRVDEYGVAEWRIASSRFTESTAWRQINTHTPEEKRPEPYKHLRSAWMRTHYVILAPELLPSFAYSRIRDELANYGGIRLYRNGFRVVPYGDKGNDWLGLDEMYVKRTFLAPIGNRNFFGVVEVRDPNGVMFEEHTSREGLLETPAFEELKHLTSAVLLTAAAEISDARGKKTRASDKQNRPTVQAGKLDKLKTAVASLISTSIAQPANEEHAGSNSAGATSIVAEQIIAVAAEQVISVAKELQQDLEEATLELADEAAMLRLLATLGMTTAEFSHETGMTFDAFRFDFERVFKAALEAKANDRSFMDKAERARSMLSRLDTLTSYLNTLASSRSTRSVLPVSLSKILEDFERGIRLQAQSLQIELTVKIPDYDPLFTRPMHEAELASILLNLYTNAVKALKRNGGERRIYAEVDRLNENDMVRLRFCDSGDGVSEQNRERIFDAFFTTRVASPGNADDMDHARGTGLGLWIVSQIVSSAEGQIAVIDAPVGFTTCFELRLPGEDDHGS